MCCAATTECPVVSQAFLGLLSNLVSLMAPFWSTRGEWLGWRPTEDGRLLLYILVRAEIFCLFAKYSVSGELYTDDVFASSIRSLAADLDSVMSETCLWLSPSKTQLIWLGTRQYLHKLDHDLLVVRFSQFIFLTSVRYLRVTRLSPVHFTEPIARDIC